MLLLALLLSLVTLNTLYINKVATRLKERVETLPDISDPACVDAALRVCLYWEEHRRPAELSVRFSLCDRISEQAKTLLACASAGDPFGFAVARALLLDAIEDLSRAESLRTLI